MSHPEPAVETQAEPFLDAMRALAGGVVMVTTRVDGRPWGVTVSACCSVSVDPPHVLVSLASGTASRSSAVESGRFGVSLLRCTHKRLAEIAARPGAAKFIDGCLGSAGGTGQAPAQVATPMVAGALHHLDCTIAKTVEVCDHTLLIGRVERVVPGRVVHGRRGRPLVYVERAFRHVGEQIQ